MAYSTKDLRVIYDRTNGRCHICGSKRAFTNYGLVDARGGWHVDHSVARANGGTDHGNNLKVACIGCNCSKGAASTRSARRQYGRTSAPLSKVKQKESDFWWGLAKVVLTLAGVVAAGKIMSGSGTPGAQPRQVPHNRPPMR